MKERKINKTYIAKIAGIPDIKEGRIEAPIDRICEGNIKREVREDGKMAITEYTVTHVIGGDSICKIKLHTGRTHQIRVHMAYIGHPLVGDFLYGEDSEEGYSLICSEITLPHPLTDETITLNIPSGIY